ncbi:hypothetical protein D918_07448 [Trichuris suis]|nr:hypothetical protein D918_07448 [Trichuris suis]
MRSVVKEDLGFSVAEMVYGQTICLPGEFFIASNEPARDRSRLISDVRTAIQRMVPMPTNHHGNPTPFVHKDLMSSSHVLVRKGGVKKPLTAPYDGPFRVIERSKNFFTLDMHGEHRVVCLDRLKPAFSPRMTPSRLKTIPLGRMILLLSRKPASVASYEFPNVSPLIVDTGPGVPVAACLISL